MATHKLTRDDVRRFVQDSSGGDSLLWDGELAGFGVRRYPGGRASFILQWRDRGRQRRRALGSVSELSLKQAREAAQQLLARQTLEEAGVVNRRQESSPVFLARAREWLNGIDVRERTLVEYRRHIERDCRPLHKMRVHEIRQKDIADLLDEVENERGKTTADRLRSTLSGLWGWLVEHEDVSASPVEGTRSKRAKPKPRRSLTLDDVRAVYEAATEIGGNVGDVVRVVLLTSTRRDEIGSALAAEINVEMQSLELPNERSKPGVGYAIPLVGDAWEIVEARLDRRSRRGEPYRSLFSRRVGSPGVSGWSDIAEQVAKAAGFKHFEMHELRHAFSTHCNELGLADPHVVEAQLNHRTGVGRAGVAGLYNRATYWEQRRQLCRSWHEVITGRWPAE